MIKLLKNNTLHSSPSKLTKHFSQSFADKTIKFHNTIPQYKPTPLIELKESAAEIGVEKLWLKDESQRMGLKAFKVLGASYAICNIIYDLLDWDKNELSFQKLLNEDLSKFTFVTATDGNHGRGVAWIANQLGCKSFVFMPDISSKARINNIKEFASEVFVVDGNYDFASAKAAEFAKKESAILVQDSSWDGYEDIPLTIMQGYLTLIDEIYGQLKGETFTHIFLHCGVGSMPATIEAYLVNRFGKNKPKTIIVEPNKADCFYRSTETEDGKPHTINGKLDSIMAGLSCGTPSKLAWDIISKHSNYFISCDDGIAKLGMRKLAKQNIISGESGAVSYGILKYASDYYESIFEKLEIDNSSKILLISTEGNTDPDIYNTIVTRSGASRICF